MRNEVSSLGRELGEELCVLHSLMVDAQPEKQDMPFAFSDSLQAFQPFTLCRDTHFGSHSDFPVLVGLALKVHLNLSIRLSSGALSCATQGCNNSRSNGLEGTSRQGLNNRAAVGTVLENTAAFILFYRQNSSTSIPQWV